MRIPRTVFALESAAMIALGLAGVYRERPEPRRPLAVAARRAPRLNARAASDTLIVSTDWLARHLNDANLVVLHIDRGGDSYPGGHVPGARNLDYMQVVTTKDGIGT